MIQKITVLNIIVYKNPGSRRKRFLRFSLSKKSIVDYFVLPFLQESHQNLCHSTVVEQWSIISLKHTLKELMLINQKWEKQTSFGNRNSVTTSKERPLATGTSVARGMVTRHRCYSACSYPHPFAHLIPFGLMSWMKGFQIFDFSCVSSKEGTVLVWLIFKGKIRKRGKEEWMHGRTWAGSHAEEGQLAGGLGNEIKPETTPPSSNTWTKSWVSGESDPWGPKKPRQCDFY